MSKKDDGINSQIINGRTPNPGWFAKGKSGNPKGRPRKNKEKPAADSSVRNDFLRAAEALMKLTESGKEIQIPVHAAVKRAEILSAMKGSSHAQRNFLERYERLCNERMEEIENNHLQWRTYIIAYETIIKEYADRSAPLPDYYPHPDELQFSEGQPVTGWLGEEPIQAAILRRFYTRLRDVWLLQSEKDRRHFGSKEELDHISGMIGLFINALLPKAFQLDEVTLTIRLGKQRTLRKHELQHRLTAAWVDIGFPGGKKWTTWPLNESARTQLLQRLRERALRGQTH